MAVTSTSISGTRSVVCLLMWMVFHSSKPVNAASSHSHYFAILIGGMMTSMHKLTTVVFALSEAACCLSCAMEVSKVLGEYPTPSSSAPVFKSGPGATMTSKQGTPWTSTVVCVPMWMVFHSSKAVKIANSHYWVYALWVGVWCWILQKYISQADSRGRCEGESKRCGKEGMMCLLGGNTVCGAL